MKRLYLMLVLISMICTLRAELLIVNDISDLPAVDPSVSALTSSGTITLRSAIQRSNFNGGSNTINFSIAGTGPFIITPASPYDTITNSLTIDGYTQPGALPNTNTPQDGGLNAIIMIEIQGQNILNSFGQPAFETTCFITVADGCIFKGLAINQFFGTGIAIFAEDTIISGCFIGTDASGTQQPGGQFRILKGINGVINRYCRIGGIQPADRNIILGFYDCITIDQVNDFMPPIGLAEIQGNLFNTDITGTQLLSNAQYAIAVTSSGRRNFTYMIGGPDAGARNLISGSSRAGILMYITGGTQCVIENNYIGTDITGMQSLANTNGISTSSILKCNTHSYIRNNLISGNRADGIVIATTEVPFYITGNILGLNATQDAPLPNGKDGIFLFNAKKIFIGDGTPAGANVIAGNGRDGIWIGANSWYNTIQGNYIGISSNDIEAGNNRYGIRIGGDIEPAHRNSIGGITNNERNTISFNNLHGIHISRISDGTQVLNNLLVKNGQVGIWDSNTSRQSLIQGNTISGSPQGVVVGADVTDESQAAIISNMIAS